MTRPPLSTGGLSPDGVRADICRYAGQAVETNPLYWLRTIDCADRLMPKIIGRAQRRVDDDTTGKMPSGAGFYWRMQNWSAAGAARHRDPSGASARKYRLRYGPSTKSGMTVRRRTSTFAERHVKAAKPSKRR